MSAGQYFEFLKRLETDPSFCFRYITDEGLDKKHPTYKQCVLTISKSARYSRLFAEKMVKGRFEWRQFQRMLLSLIFMPRT